jgi:hypothetical protein
MTTKKPDDVTNGTPLVERTSAGLRSALFDELDALRSGSSNAAKANAVAKLASQVIDTVKMELEVHRHLAKAKPNEAPPQLGAPVAL